MPTVSEIKHDPDARLDYSWDWSAWLAEGETITEAVVTAPTGLTVSASTITGGTVSVWIEGGTEGTTYRVPCHIVTSQDREDDRTLRLFCISR